MFEASEEIISNLRDPGFEDLNLLLVDLMLEFEKDWQGGVLPPGLFEISQELERAIVEFRWRAEDLGTAIFALGKTVWKSNGPPLVALASKAGPKIDNSNCAYQLLIALENYLEASRYYDPGDAKSLLSEFASRPDIWNQNPLLCGRVSETLLASR